MRLVIGVAAVLLLAGCGSDDKSVTTSAVDAGGNKVASSLAIDTDGFKANVEIPGLEFTGKNMDIDGIKLYPGSSIRGMKVKASDKNGTDTSNVVFDFVSPAPPADVAKHLLQQAEDAGYTVTRAPDRDGAAVIEGKKDERGETNRLRFVLKPSGAQTAGTATVDGADS